MRCLLVIPADGNGILSAWTVSLNPSTTASEIDPTNENRPDAESAPDLVGSMAGVTGLEPATSGLTGQRSNQLSYTPKWVSA